MGLYRKSDGVRGYSKKKINNTHILYFYMDQIFNKVDKICNKCNEKISGRRKTCHTKNKRGL